MYRTNMRRLAVVLLLNCLVIPATFIVVSRLIWVDKPIIFLGLIASLAWVYLFGGATTKKIQKLKEQKDKHQDSNLE